MNAQHSAEKPSPGKYVPIVEGDMPKETENGEHKEMPITAKLNKKKEVEGLVTRLGENDVHASWYYSTKAF